MVTVLNTTIIGGLEFRITRELELFQMHREDFSCGLACASDVAGGVVEEPVRSAEDFSESY